MKRIIHPVAGTIAILTIRVCVIERAAGGAHCHEAEAHAADSRELTFGSDPRDCTA